MKSFSHYSCKHVLRCATVRYHHFPFPNFPHIFSIWDRSGLQGGQCNTCTLFFLTHGPSHRDTAKSLPDGVFSPTKLKPSDYYIRLNRLTQKSTQTWDNIPKATAYNISMMSYIQTHAHGPCLSVEFSGPDFSTSPDSHQPADLLFFLITVSAP